MRWEKKGLIYCPNNEHEWEFDTFMTPHAMEVEPGIIRIWGGVRDKLGISRIKYIDVNADNPSQVLYISDHLSLDCGRQGCFDDNGMILGDVVKVEDQLYLYYVGFQHVQKVKFFAFSGLAISDDMGKTFHRYSEVPILDRTATGRFGRCVHTVLYDEGIFKCYYTVIDGWKIINSIPYPKYNIWYLTSKDGIQFERKDSCLCIDVQGDEYRIGRPKVYKTSFGYEMFYTRDTINKEYIIGYAVSKDGINWTRRDENVGIQKSVSGWDSEMVCYAVRLSTARKNYLFYSGNGMGRTGVGYAELNPPTEMEDNGSGGGGPSIE